MKKLLFKTIFFLFFISGFSQNSELELSYEIDYEGQKESKYDGKILQSYHVKNAKGEIIGSLSLSSSEETFEYFNAKKKIVAYGFNFDKTYNTPFAIKNKESFVRDIKSREIIFKQKWNLEEGRFDIYSSEEKIIGNMSYNLESGSWELYRIQSRSNTYEANMTPIFANYFEVNSGNNNGSNVVKSTYQIVTGNVVDNQGVPLPGATILVKGSGDFATTDFDGNFSLEASQGDVLIVSFVGYKTNNTTIGSGKNYTIRLTQKKKSFSPLDVYGFSFNISQNVAQSLQDNQGGNDQKNNGSSKIRFGAEYHDLFGDYNSMGITFGIGKSDTLVSDEYNLSDIDFAVTYGLSFLYNIMKLKVGLGYYSKNYNVTESFGPFYDFEEGVYYSAGLQLYIPLGYTGITLDGYYNNYGLGYGIGFKF